MIFQNLSFELPKITKEANSKIYPKDFFSFMLLVFNLGALLFVIYEFQLEVEISEGWGLEKLLKMVWIGFLINAFIPISYRLPFFSFFTCLTIGLIYTWGALFFLLIILFIIFLAHLNANYWNRIFGIIFIISLLIIFRSDQILVFFDSSFISNKLFFSTVLPIVGSMLMFRLIIYLYDLKYLRKPVSFWKSLAYFMMLPNVSIVLFPAVDFKKFNQTYYNVNAIEIYNKGLRWILRGVVFLLIYRSISYYFAIYPPQVSSTIDLFVYMVTNYAVIFRLVGILWISVGILCLFGMNLPPIFDNFLLATSPLNYWRRINIYWKEMIKKVFWSPAYFKMKKFGPLIGLVLSYIIGFTVSWLLHSWQLFWVQGTFPIVEKDYLFWGLFGFCLTIQAIYQYYKPPTVSSKWTFRSSLKEIFQIITMFLFINFLWALWSTSSIADYFELLSILNTVTTNELIILFTILLFIVILGILLSYINNKLIDLFKVMSFIPLSGFNKNNLLITFSTIILFIASIPKTEDIISTKFGFSILPIINNIPNEHLENLEIRGYYEELLEEETERHSFNESTSNKRTDDWIPLQKTSIVSTTNSILSHQLLPNYTSNFKGALLTTNRDGLRDKDYDLIKPDNTIRMAMVGGSIEMGSGVNNEDVFEALVENKLNNQNKNNNYEILNFSAGGYYMLQSVFLLKEKIVKYNPDVLFFCTHKNDEILVFSNLATLIKNENKLNFAFLDSLLAYHEIDASLSKKEIQKKLIPLKNEVYDWAFKEVKSICNDNNIRPIWVYVPLPVYNQEKLYGSFDVLATKYGFEKINLLECYARNDYESLWIAPWDKHPNKIGHQLLADKFYKELDKHKHWLK